MSFLVWLVPVLLLAATVVGILALVGSTGRPAVPASGSAIADDADATGPYARTAHTPTTGQGTVRRARRRGLICVGLALTVLVAGVAADTALPELLGIPLALTPGLAATVGLLAYALWPVRIDRTAGPTAASLVPRTPWTFGRRRDFSVVVALAAITVGFLGWAAVVADPDEAGRMRDITFVSGPVTSSAGPFPGSYYGIPLIIVTLLLTLAGYLALRRVSTVPAAVDPSDPTDRRWREAASRMITLLVSAALLGYLGGTAYFAGHAIRSAAISSSLNSGGSSVSAVAGTTLALVGVGLVLTGVVVGLLAVAAALTVRARLVGDPVEAAATAGRS